jgi:DNA end-binding protein Ku
LVKETMYFADEIRPNDELAEIPSDANLSEREIDTAKMLIDAMAAKWDPEAYEDTYRERVEGLVRQKLEGREIVTEAAPPERAPVVDLIAALNASMERISGARGEEAKGAGDKTRPAASARSTRKATKASSGGGRQAAAKKSPAKGATASTKKTPAKKAAPAKTSRRKAS